MRYQALIAMSFVLLGQMARAEVPAPVVACPAATTSLEDGRPVPGQSLVFDSKDGDIKRIPPSFSIRKRDQRGQALEDAHGNPVFESVYLVVDTDHWLVNSYTIEERERSTQLATDVGSILKQLKGALFTAAKGSVEERLQAQMAPATRYCIEYNPTLEHSTVLIGRKKADARKEDTFDLIAGALEHTFVPLALTANKVISEKYDSATQQVIANRQHSLLFGYGAKIGDFYTHYPTRGEPGYWKNFTVSALLRPKLWERTWGAGFAIGYPLVLGADAFVGGLWVKGDGPGAHARGSANFGVMVPVSVALGSSN